MEQRRLMRRSAFFLLCAALITTTGLAEGTDNKNRQAWFDLVFIGLKQGASIRNARFFLHDKGTLSFEIKNENITGTKGAYRCEGIRLSATIEFSIKRRKVYRYVLALDGIKLIDIYAGIAKLQEHIEGNVITQELPFVFVAHPEESSSEKGRKRFMNAG